MACKVLVTGGTGFVGANLVAALLQRGYAVRVLRRSSSSLVGLAGLDVEQCSGDLLDPVAVGRAVTGCQLVFHVAALSSYWRARRAWVYAVNVTGTRIVMDACLNAGVERLVHTSSAAAIGIAPDGQPATEQTPFDRLSASFAYADSKRLAELEVQRAITRGLDAVIVNPTTVIGAGDHYRNASSIVIEYGRGRIPVVPPGGMCVADVDAVTAGHLAAAERGQCGERYILGGENLSHRALTAMVADSAGCRAPGLVVPAALLGPASVAVDLFNQIAPRQP